MSSSATTNTMTTLATANINGGGDGDPGATISRKFSPFARTLKKNTFRAKEMMMAKFGKHDRTTDEMFDDHVVQIQRQHQVAARFARELKAYVGCVRALANASKMLNMVVRDEAFEDAWHGASSYIATSHATESLWNDYCDALNSALLPTTQLYLDQFADIQARIAKRNRKLVDYDGARHELAAAEASKKRDDQKVLKAQEFLTRTKFAFEEINGELNRRLPRVRDSRVLFYAKTIHDLADVELKFNTRLADTIQQSMPVLARLVEEAEAGQYKSVWRSEAQRAQQRTATFQNNFHKRTSQTANHQQAHAPPAAGAVISSGPLRSVLMVESYDLQMSAPPPPPISREDLQELHATDNISSSTDDEPNDRHDDIDSSDEDAVEDSTKNHRQSSSSSSSRRRVSGGLANAAALHMRSVISKANGLLHGNTTNNASTSSNGKRATSHDDDDEHDGVLFDSGGGAVDAEDAAAAAAVEFKGIRQLDDDGEPTRDNNNSSAAAAVSCSRSRKSSGPTTTTTGPTRPPLPPAPSAHARQQQYVLQQMGEQQQSCGSSTSSSAAARPTTTTFEHETKSDILISTGNAADAASSCSSIESRPTADKNNFDADNINNNNVSRVMLRQSEDAAADQESATTPIASSPSKLSLPKVVAENGEQQLHAMLQSRKLLYRARATHAYKGEDADELSFGAGELIYVVEYDNADDQDVGWQMGIRATTGDMGVFPENFTRVLIGGE